VTVQQNGKLSSQVQLYGWSVELLTALSTQYNFHTKENKTAITKPSLKLASFQYFVNSQLYNDIYK